MGKKKMILPAGLTFGYLVINFDTNKLTGLKAYIMFYKIRKFESSTITNDVIMTSLPKTKAKFGPRRNQTNYEVFYLLFEQEAT